jgi:hypothetical protein
VEVIYIQRYFFIIATNFYISNRSTLKRVLSQALNLNNDTQQRNIIIKYNTNNVCLFLGYGNGTFKTSLIPLAGYNSRHTLIPFIGDNYVNQKDIYNGCLTSRLTE